MRVEPTSRIESEFSVNKHIPWDRFWRLVEYALQQVRDSVLLKGWLKRRDMVKRHAHRPDVAALVVALVADDFGRQRKRRTNDVRLKVVLYSKRAALAKVT